MKKGMINKILALIGVIIISGGYSKVYLATLPIIVWYLAGHNKIFKIASIVIITAVSWDLIITKFGNFIFLNSDEIFGFDVLWLSEYIFDNYPAKYDYLYGKSIWGVIVNIIPREFWSEKPIAFGVELSMQYWNKNIEDIFTNYGPGIIGESYANFGYLGIPIFAIITGLGMKLGYSIWLKHQYITSLFFLPFIVLLIRGDFLNASINLIIQFLVLYFLNPVQKNSYG